jgi:ferritin
MNKELVQLLNDQMNLELASAYLYVDMGIAMKFINADGYAHWFEQQVHEEVEHAEKIAAFLLELDHEPELKNLEIERPTDRTPLAIAKAALEHEKFVTKSIWDLRKAALDAGDQAVEIFLQWFITEQVEEEDQAKKVVDLIEMAGDDFAAKLKVDAILGSR